MGAYVESYPKAKAGGKHKEFDREVPVGLFCKNDLVDGNLEIQGWRKEERFG